MAPAGLAFADEGFSKRRRAVRLWSAAALFIALLGLLLAATWFIANRENASDLAKAGRWTISAQQARRFTLPPDKDAAELVTKTAADREFLRSLSPDQARAANALIPLATDIGPPARPFFVPIENGGQDYLKALDCMAAAIYYEAEAEPVDGQRAVAQVVLNRVRHLAYPHSICGVVFQGAERSTGCQFSFTCDGSTRRKPSAAGWALARRIAAAAMRGAVYAPVSLATHYHADYVLPYWAPTLVKQRIIGRHIFYRWPGAWGKPASFATRYDGAESAPQGDGQMLWAEMNQMDNMSESADALAAGEQPLSAARPVIAMAGEGAGAAAPYDGKGIVRLFSRAPPAPQSAPSAASSTAPPPSLPRQSVTGGVILSGAPAANRPVASEKTGEPERKIGP